MARNAKTTPAVAVAETKVEPANTITYEAIIGTFKDRALKAKAPVDARVAVQVKLYGSVEGILYVLIANGIVVVEPFDYKGADIEVDADADALFSVLNNKLKMSTAIAAGNIKMQGNAGKAIILADAVL